VIILKIFAIFSICPAKGYFLLLPFLPRFSRHVRVGGAVLGTALVYFYDKIFVPQLFAWLALLWPQGVYIGMVPDIRGTNFFNFGIVLYLTVLWRAREK
jgi:hypothetical protein